MGTHRRLRLRDGCVGRCDAKCYTSHEPGCNRIYGGANHGAGFNQAAENTRQHAEKWLARATEAGWAFDHAELGAATAPTLF